jgi:hypothetical protein
MTPRPQYNVFSSKLTQRWALIQRARKELLAAVPKLFVEASILDLGRDAKRVETSEVLWYELRTHGQMRHAVERVQRWLLDVVSAVYPSGEGEATPESDTPEGFFERMIRVEEMRSETM